MEPAPVQEVQGGLELDGFLLRGGARRRRRGRGGLRVSDVLNRVHLLTKVAPMVGLVEACLSLDFEDWVDVLAELYQVPTLVTDFSRAL